MIGSASVFLIKFYRTIQTSSYYIVPEGCYYCYPIHEESYFNDYLYD